MVAETRAAAKAATPAAVKNDKGKKAARKKAVATKKATVKKVAAKKASSGEGVANDTVTAVAADGEQCLPLLAVTRQPILQ